MNNISKNLLGIWLFMITDCIMFTIMFISFLSSKNNFFLKNLIYNYRTLLIETIILLFCNFIALKLIKKNEKKKIFLIFLFSLIFLNIEFKDLIHLNFLHLNFCFNNFMSNYFFIILFHALHIILSILILINFIFTKKNNFKINKIFFSIFWNFIHIIWLCLTYIYYIKK